MTENHYLFLCAKIGKFVSSKNCHFNIFQQFVNAPKRPKNTPATARHANWTVLHFDRNYGNSAAFKATIDYCQTPPLGHIDADLQTDPEDFNFMLPHMDEFALVCRDRVKRNDKLSRKTITYGWMIKRYLKYRFK